jgi:hypothetical protein
MRSGHITVVELLVIIFILGIVAALFLPAVGSKAPLTDKDLHLDDWLPGPEHSAVPPDSIRVRDVDLEGEWTDGIGWTDLKIKSLPDGRYSVSFLSHARCGLSGSVQFERYAKYDDGVLLLDRPVRELRGTTYRQLFSVRVNDDIYLLPPPRVTEVHDINSEIPFLGVLSRNVHQ